MLSSKRLILQCACNYLFRRIQAIPPGAGAMPLPAAPAAPVAEPAPPAPAPVAATPPPDDADWPAAPAPAAPAAPVAAQPPAAAPPGDADWHGVKQLGDPLPLLNAAGRLMDQPLGEMGGSTRLDG